MIRDPGLQAERTALAWSRTGLAVLGNAALTLRVGWAMGSTVITILAVTLFGACAIVVSYGAWRRRVLLSTRADIAPSHRAIGLATLLALGTAALGIACLVVS